MQVTCRAGWWAPVLLLLAVSSVHAGEVSLIETLMSGGHPAVRTLLSQTTEVNVIIRSVGPTAVLDAVERDDLRTAEQLIRGGASVTAQNRYGFTPLLVAATRGNAAMLELLLKAGADPNGATAEGETALMMAARTSADAVKILLGYGARVDTREKWRGQTALMMAAARNQADTVQVLVEAGADIHLRSDGGFTPVLFAARVGQAEALRALLKAGGNPNETLQESRADDHGFDPPLPKNGKPPKRLVTIRDAATLEKLDGNGAKADEKTAIASELVVKADAAVKITAAYFAVAKKDESKVNGLSALLLAVINANFEAARILVENGADVNDGSAGFTALHQLAWTRKPNVDRPTPYRLPPGWEKDSLDLAKVLLEHGADPNARMTGEPKDGMRNMMRRIGATPFLLAAKGADAPYMRLLADHGADPNLTTELGTTPLMAAAGVGIWRVGESAGTNEEAFEAVKLAYELGNDPKAIDQNGDTAMHGAVLRDSLEMVRWLADKGTPLDLANKRGATPLTLTTGVQYANVINLRPEAEKLLRELGAKNEGTKLPEDIPAEEIFVLAPQQTAN